MGEQEKSGKVVLCIKLTSIVTSVASPIVYMEVD